MPSINIYEKDETFPSGLTGTDVVFVLGMATSTTEEDYLNKATLFETFSGFQTHIGKTPYKWQSAQDVSKPTATGVDSSENDLTVDTIKFISYYNKTCMNLNNLLYPENPLEIVFTFNGEVLPKDYTFSDNKSGRTSIPYSELVNYGISDVQTPPLGPGYSFTITVTYTNSNTWGVADNVTPTVYAEDYDTGYLYASELLFAGIPVIYYAYKNTQLSDNAQTVSDLYSAMDDVLELIKDKGEYSPKYITMGGYPVLGYNNNVITKKMVEVAATRGDCVALIDHTDKADRPLAKDDTASVYYEVKQLATDENFEGQFGAVFTPWATYDFASLGASSKNQKLPGSYAYCISLAQSVKTNANWFAIAGVTRGLVPNLVSKKDAYALDTEEVLTNAIADSYQNDQDVSINAITNIRPYGYTIWGNRTLKDNTITEGTTATSFLNLRNLINDVKKVAYTAAKSLMFEQNTDILWINFKSKLTPTLDRMSSGQGLSGYKIIKETPTDGDRTKVQAKIILYPVYAVEKFDITVIIRNEDIEVA